MSTTPPMNMNTNTPLPWFSRVCRHAASAIALIAVAFTASRGVAGTTWDGGGADTNINTAGNWNDNSLPAFSGGTSTLFFSTGGTSATLNTSLDIARIILNATPTFSIGSSGGSTLTLQGENLGGMNTGITAQMPWLVGSGSYTLSAPVILGADQSWNVSNGSGPTTLLVTSPIAGSGRSLTKLGNGTLALAAANTYTGATNVNAGALELRSGASLAGPVAVAAPATLRFANGTLSTVTASSALSGAGSLAVTGGGAVQLTGNNASFTGATSITSGELAISSAAALGSGTSAISVVGIPDSMIGNGSAMNATYAYYPAGGQLAIVSGAGLTLSRNLQLSGMGMRQQGTGGSTANISPTLRSTGNNVLSGTVQFSNAALQSSFGTLELAGGITTAVSTGTATLGGMGNVLVSSPVSLPSGVLQLQGGVGTVRLTNASNSISQITFAGSFISSGYSTNSGLEVATAAVLGGARISQQTTSQTMNGRLQIRTAAADAAGFGTANVTYTSGGPSTVFIDNARGGSDLNQTVALRYGATTFSNQGSFILGGGHGYGLSLTGTGGGTIFSAFDRGILFGNGSNGLLTINADVSSANGTNMTGIGFTTGANSAGTDGAGDILFNGSFLISTANTAIPLQMSSPARVVMVGTGNQMTGNNNLNNGTLAIRGLGALASGTINMGNAANPAALEFLGAATTGAGETWTRAINLSGTSGGAYLYANQAGTAPTALTINGPITATGTGAKTLVIGGSSTQQNTVAASIPNSAGSTVTSLQKTGLGTWVLSGTNRYTGPTTVSGGVLRLQAGAGDIVQNASAVVFDRDAFTNAAAGTLLYSGSNNATSTETVGALTPTAGAARIIASGSGTGSATLTFASLGTRTAGATVDFGTTSGGAFAFTSGPAGTSGILGGWATFGGTDWVNAGTTASQFTGYQTIGSSSNSSTTNFQLTTGSVALSGAASVNSLKVVGSSGTTALTLGGVLTNTTGGVVFDNTAGSAQITGSTLGAAGSEVIIHTGGSGGSSNVLTIGSLIGSGATALTKSGSGTLVLTAANTYTGNTTINEGTLRLSNAAALGAPGTSNRTAIRQAGVLDLGVANMSGTAGILDGAGRITSSAASGTATLAIGQGNGTTGYFTGVIENGTAGGRVGLTKVGTGSQFLTGQNTYTGPTTISSGTLAVTSLANIGQASGIGAGDATNADTNAASLVFNGGVLQYTGANGVVYQATQTPSVSIDRLFTLAGNGTIDSSGRYGDNDLTLSANTFNAATLILSNTGAVRFSGAAGSRTLTLQGSVGTDSRGNMSYDNQIGLRLADGASNTLALTKAGNTLWKLTNTGNSYSGDTTVSNGMLEVGDDSSSQTRTLSQNSNLNLSGGILVSSGTFARSVGTGAGAVRLTGAANTGFAAGPGDLVVNLGSGTLSWGSTNFNPSTLYLNGPTSLGAVTFASPIDLNNGSRTISVIDNINSAFDYAIVSGVISGSGGLTKTSPLSQGATPYGGPNNNVQLSPALRLTGLNTFTGTTTISGGPLVVETIGNSASTASNLGAGSAVVVVGSSGRLDYIGSGETTNRQISNTANGSVEINNNGSGPLVLTNLGMTATSGASTLTLGGFYPGANEIRSNLAPTASGTINLTLSTLSTWTLSGTNTLGTVLIGPGAILGIGSDAALNASATLTVGSFSRVPQIAAVGGARTVANNISLSAAGDNFGFTGDNSITYSGTLAIAGHDRIFFNNSITSGSLSITGPISNSTNTINLKGSGQTVVSGSILGSGNVRYYSADTTAALTFSGNYAGIATTGTVFNDGFAPIIFASASAIPGTGANVSAAAGSTLAAGYAVDQAFLNRIAAGSLTNSFAVGLAADSANNLDFSSAGRNLTNASLGAVGSTTRVYSGTLTPNGTTYRLGGGGGTLDVQGPLTGAGNTVAIGGDPAGLGGTVILSNTGNSFGVSPTVARGILRVAMLNDSGLNSPLGTSDTINLGSGTTAGTLQYSGTGGHSTNRLISLAGGGGTLDASGSGTVAFTGGVSAGAGVTLTLAGDNTGGNYIQSITGSNVVKTGPGTWVLGSNSYTGTLAIQQGTIIASVNAGNSGTSSALGKGNGPIPLLGLVDATGTAALLAADGVTIARVIEVAALGSGDQEVVLGGSGAGEATFDAGSAFRLGRGVTLAADAGGNARFLTPTGNWQQQNGSADPAVAVTIGTPAATGTVTLETTLPDSITAVTVRQGTLRLGNGTTVGALGPNSVLTGSAGATLAFDRSDTITSGVAFAATIGGAMNVTQLGSGTVVLAGVNTYTGTTSIAAGAIRVSGSGRIADSARIDVGAAGRIVFDRTDDYGGAYDGKLAGSGQLTVQSGSLTLTGLNTFAGSSAVMSGAVLELDGQIDNTTLSVASGATLMGSGTILGTTTIAGLHSPGNSPGIQSLGNLTYLSGASVQWELWNNTTLNTATPPDYDQILLTGDLAFSGPTTFNLLFSGSAGPTNYSEVAWGDVFWDTNQEWLVYDVAGTTTGFGNLSLATTNWADGSTGFFNTARPGSSFQLEQRGNDVYLVYTVVPEPGAVALATIGLAAAAYAHRRRRHRCLEARSAS